jgi:hypothetical protein
MAASMLEKNVEISNLEEEVQRLLLHNECLMKEKDNLYHENGSIRDNGLSHLKQV